MYVKIIREDTHYNVLLEPFTTQHGKNAVRFTGDEIPTTNKGFMLYDDNDTEIGDLSRYKYEYRQNEYSDEQDVIEQPSGNNEPLPPSPIDVRMRNMSAQISAIAPYIESKEAGIQDKECIFFGSYKNGLLTANVVTSRGEQIPCKTEKSGDDIIVKFAELEDTATVTISIQ